MDPNTQEEKVKISFVMILCIMFAICIIGGFWIGRGIAPKEYVPMQISSEEMEKIAKQYLDWHPELIPTVKTAQEKIYKQIIDNTYAMKKV